MNINETHVSHTGLVDVGRIAFFIDVTNDGVFIEKDDLIKQAICFPRVVLFGEPFEQKDDIAKFCKKVVKEKRSIKIEINTDGTIRPVGIINMDIIYNVHLKLKISNIDYNNRIKPSIINWFNEVEANFVFNVNTEDEMDETNLIIQENNIKKQTVYLTFTNYEKLQQVRKWSKKYGFNFAPDFKTLLWPKDGRK